VFLLVLRVENGRDHFVPIKATWMQSVFFRELDELVLAPEGGVRQWAGSARNKATEMDSNASDSGLHHSAPKELYTLTEIIPIYIERSIAEWGMLHDGDTPPWLYDSGGSSWPFSKETWTFHEGDERSDMLAAVREALDTASRLDGKFDPNIPSIVRMEVLAETLTFFLGSLRDGIVPADAWTQIDTNLTSMQKGKAQPTAQEVQDMVMDALSSSPVHSVSFTFITFLLIRIINEMVPNGPPATEVATPTTPSSVSRKLSRRSRASTLSSDSGHAPSISSQEAHKRTFFPSLRRLHSTSSQSIATETSEAEAAVATRRKRLVDAYTEVFAPIVFRVENEARQKEKDKKALDTRKRRVLEAFLAERHS